MQAFYGYKDGSGEWFIIIDTDRCDGCGRCVEACPAGSLEVGEDAFDPLSEKPVARVREGERKKIRYTCAPCQPGYGEAPAPCVAACQSGAISHTEAWQQSDAKK
jgi:Fe-S-cluster-containing hydrogenase component 2